MRTLGVALGGTLTVALAFVVGHLFTVGLFRTALEGAAGTIVAVLIGIIIGARSLTLFGYRFALLSSPSALFGVLAAALVLLGDSSDWKWEVKPTTLFSIFYFLTAVIAATWGAALSLNFSREAAYVFATDDTNNCIKRLQVNTGQLTEAYRPAVNNFGASKTRVHNVLFPDPHQSNDMCAIESKDDYMNRGETVFCLVRLAFNSAKHNWEVK